MLDLCVYEWALPEDIGPLEEGIVRILDGGVDAVAFTSQVQVRHLFLVAADVGGYAERQCEQRHANQHAVGRSRELDLADIGAGIVHDGAFSGRAA